MNFKLWKRENRASIENRAVVLSASNIVETMGAASGVISDASGQNVTPENRSSIENPAVPLSASNIIETMGAAFGVISNASGQNVTPDNAKTYAAVYAAVRLLSETIAQLPLHLYRKTDTGRTLATDHAVYELMHNSPSDELGSYQWRETKQGHVLTWGNGYSFIQRGIQSGSVRGLQLLRPDRVSSARTKSGKLVYQARINGDEFSIAPQDMVHIPAFGFDGICGYSPITVHRETIGLGKAATKFGAQLFGNGTSPGGVLTHPDSLSAEARSRIQAGWDKFRGAGYQGAVLLEEGLSYTRIGIPPEDAQFLETRRFQVVEIARIYNIPPHMLRDLEKSSFNNISEQSIEFVRYSILPWLIKWEQELNRKLLTDSERRAGHYFKFNVAGLLRGTQKERYDAYGTGIRDGWLSRNEVRELEDLDRVDGLDEYLVPLNMAKITDQDPKNDSADTRGTEDQRTVLQPVIRSTAGAIHTWLAATKKRSKTPEDFATRYLNTRDDMLRRRLQPVLDSIALSTDGAASQWPAQFSDWLSTQNPDALPSAQRIESQIYSITGYDHHEQS